MTHKVLDWCNRRAWLQNIRSYAKPLLECEPDSGTEAATGQLRTGHRENKHRESSERGKTWLFSDDRQMVKPQSVPLSKPDD